VVGSSQKPSSGRRWEPIHSILISIAEPVEKIKKGYDYIVRGEMIEKSSYV